jgi:hypothetical protein
MAWTAPRTWADGELPTAAQFNSNFRDNLNELALHAHQGGSGSGSASMGPLNAVTLLDTAAVAPTNASYVSLGGHSATLAWINSASATFVVSNDTHEHTGSWAAGSSSGCG